MGKTKFSDNIIEYLKTDASFPLFFPAKLRGSIANLFLYVIRHDNIREPNLVVIKIAEDLSKKKRYREVERTLILCMHDALDEVCEYAKNRVLWDKLTPDDKKLSRTATAKMMHVRIMRQEIDHQKSIIMQ